MATTKTKKNTKEEVVDTKKAKTPTIAFVLPPTMAPLANSFYGNFRTMKN